MALQCSYSAADNQIYKDWFNQNLRECWCACGPSDYGLLQKAFTENHAKCKCDSAEVFNVYYVWCGIESWKHVLDSCRNYQRGADYSVRIAK